MKICLVVLSPSPAEHLGYPTVRALKIVPQYGCIDMLSRQRFGFNKAKCCEIQTLMTLDLGFLCVFHQMATHWLS
jgi:hypothetical protein